MDLPKLIAVLHEHGFAVRLNCMGLQGFIDSGQKLEELVEFARQNKVEQLTYRSITKPQTSADAEVATWATRYRLTDNQLREIGAYVERNGTLLLNLVHEAKVYDLHGQNLCLSSCLTRNSREDIIRQLIFFPDGRLTYDWEMTGATLL